MIRRGHFCWGRPAWSAANIQGPILRGKEGGNEILVKQVRESTAVHSAPIRCDQVMHNGVVVASKQRKVGPSV